MDMLALEQEVATMQSLIESAASQDANSLFGMSQFSNNVHNAFWADWGFAGILSTVEARVDFLSSHAEVDVLDPSISMVQASNGVLEAEVTDATTVEFLWTNNMNAAEFEPIEMVDTGVSGDVQAGDGVYTAYIPVGANPEFLFYIRASNDEAMSLKPARAEYEYYIYDASATADVTAMSAPSDRTWSIAPNPARQSFRLVHRRAVGPREREEFRGETRHPAKGRCGNFRSGVNLNDPRHGRSRCSSSRQRGRRNRS